MWYGIGKGFLKSLNNYSKFLKISCQRLRRKRHFGIRLNPSRIRPFIYILDNTAILLQLHLLHKKMPLLKVISPTHHHQQQQQQQKKRASQSASRLRYDQTYAGSGTGSRPTRPCVNKMCSAFSVV